MGKRYGIIRSFCSCLGGYLEGELSPIKSLRHGRRRRKRISDVLRNAKLAPIILHGRKMMGTAPASCLNLPKHFGSLYLEPVFFPHGQKSASAVSVFKQAILRYPLSTDMDGGGSMQYRVFLKEKLEATKCTWMYIWLRWHPWRF